MKNPTHWVMGRRCPRFNTNCSIMAVSKHFILLSWCVLWFRVSTWTQQFCNFETFYCHNCVSTDCPRCTGRDLHAPSAVDCIRRIYSMRRCNWCANISGGFVTMHKTYWSVTFGTLGTAQLMHRRGVGPDVKPYFLQFDSDQIDCCAVSPLSRGRCRFPSIREAVIASHAHSCLNLLKHVDSINNTKTHSQRATTRTFMFVIYWS